MNLSAVEKYRSSVPGYGSESWFYYLYELETNDLTSLSLYEMGLMINNKDVAQSLTPQ